MMSMMFIFLSLLLVQLMFYASHPISLGLMLVILSLITGAFLMKISISWFFYLLVLVFLGGVMVLIIYMSTLAANEKIFFKVTNKMVIFTFLSLIMLLFLLLEKNLKMKTSMGVMVAGSLYECSNMSTLIFLMIYLLLTMVCVVKLVKFESGPLIKRL
uniref:NADH dehydrogenase subunit 6 n=1 Tax=Neocalanus tonsus TaxID=148992 RepID=Q3LI88_9MAXI|nr:NADH dehydrogenase subunit 6 [Neocalanus tonsus]